MRSDSENGVGLEHLLRDPLIRLVMDSDGVTDEAMIAMVEQIRRSRGGQAARGATTVARLSN